jgi:hypothetical protein
MRRIRGQKGMKRYSQLIDEQLVIGWDNLLRGKFLKEWKIQQKAYKDRHPVLYARKMRKKKRKATQLYTMSQMVLPEDELKIYDESLET